MTSGRSETITSRGGTPSLKSLEVALLPQVGIVWGIEPFPKTRKEKYLAFKLFLLFFGFFIDNYLINPLTYKKP
jgi:hypothetical protein